MPLHLYCILPVSAAPPPPGLGGIDGHPVEAVAEGDLAAWISESPEGGASVERMEAHDRVVREALRSVTPLPVRYGPPLPDREAVQRRLREEGAALREALERVDGCVEMAVRVTLPSAGEGRTDAQAAAEGPGTPGRRYLEARRRELALMEAEAAEGEEMERRIMKDLGPVVRERRASSAASGSGTVLALSHLVLRTDLDAYRGAIAALARDGLVLTASGPWAPYSFV